MQRLLTYMWLFSICLVASSQLTARDTALLSVEQGRLVLSGEQIADQNQVYRLIGKWRYTSHEKGADQSKSIYIDPLNFEVSALQYPLDLSLLSRGVYSLDIEARPEVKQWQIEVVPTDSVLRVSLSQKATKEQKIVKRPQEGWKNATHLRWQIENEDPGSYRLDITVQQFELIKDQKRFDVHITPKLQADHHKLSKDLLSALNQTGYFLLALFLLLISLNRDQLDVNFLKDIGYFSIILILSHLVMNLLNIGDHHLILQSFVSVPYIIAFVYYLFKRPLSANHTSLEKTLLDYSCLTTTALSLFIPWFSVTTSSLFRLLTFLSLLATCLPYAYILATRETNQKKLFVNLAIVVSVPAGLLVDIIRQSVSSGVIAGSYFAALAILADRIVNINEQINELNAKSKNQQQLYRNFLASLKVVMTNVRNIGAGIHLDQSARTGNEKQDATSTLEPVDQKFPVDQVMTFIQNIGRIACQEIDIANRILADEKNIPRLTISSFALHSLFNDCVVIASNFSSTQKNATFHASHSWGDDKPNFHSDRNRITRLIYELLSNAFKFSRLNEANHVEMHFEYQNKPPKLIVTIRDEGVGLSPQLAHVLSPSRHQDIEQTLRQHYGNSLGLRFIADSITELGGKIVAKKKDVGSEFRLEISEHTNILTSHELPIETDDQTQLPKQVELDFISDEYSSIVNLADIKPKTASRILLVDARYDSREILAMILKSLGYEVIVAENTRNAMLAFDQESPQLVLTDINMPVISGLDLLCHIRRHAERFDIPVILLSNQDNSAERQISYQNLTNDYICRPYILEELVTRIEACLDLYRRSHARQKKLNERYITYELEKALIPPSLTIPGVKIETFFQPAESSGGDWFYHTYDQRYHRLYLAIGDVTGQGASSALISAAAAGDFRAFSTRFQKLGLHQPLDRSLRELIDTMNYATYEALRRSKKLMTMAFVVIDLETGDTLYSNAGHVPAYIVSQHKFEPLIMSGSPLGLSEHINLTYKRFKLAPDTILFFNTDGLIENTGPSGQSLNYKNLCKLLAEIDPSKTDNICIDVLQAAQKIWQNLRPQDDVAMAAIHWSHATNRQDQAS